jgi:hypothetical protein
VAEGDADKGQESHVSLIFSTWWWDCLRWVESQGNLLAAVAIVLEVFSREIPIAT